MKNLLRLTLSAAISLLILALLLQLVNHGLSEQQRPSVLAALQATSLALLGAYFAVYLVTLLFRSIRYRMLIILSGEENPPSLAQMALVTGVRNMLVDMLPARAGELGYVGLLNRGYGVGLQHCASSLTIAIAFDFLALLVVAVLLVVSQLTAGQFEGWAMTAVLVVALVTLSAFVGLFTLLPATGRWLRARYPHAGSSPAWHARVLHFVEQFGDSLTAVRQSGRFVAVFLLSTIIRFLKYFSLYLLFLAVTTNSFESLAALSPQNVVSALIGGELGASMPVPTFMSFGVYEAGGTLVFQLLGVADQAQAAVALLCTHIWSQFLEYMLGGFLLLVFVLLVLPLKTANSARRGRQLVIVMLAGAALLGTAGLAAWELRNAQKAGAVAPPPSGVALLPGGEALKAGSEVIIADPEPMTEAAAVIDSSAGTEATPVSNPPSPDLGFVVFSSNRTGNHDIFRLRLPGRELSKLTTHPNTETFARISPDGSKLVFARAQQIWVSQRNLSAWNIVVLDLQTGEEQQVGINGTYPQWINDREISYLQTGQRVIAVDVVTLQSRVLFVPGKGNTMPANARIHTPDVHPVSGELVFTGRQAHLGIQTGHWGTALASPAGIRGLINGCELVWSHDGSGLYQVSAGASASSVIKQHGIIRVDLPDFTPRMLINLQGEFTHEYWPEDSNDGEYLVFGASRGADEHEHDVADYEIFLWQRGDPMDKATRLTFHTGNDNWPDVFIYPN